MRLPFAGVIEGWHLVADSAVTCVIDVWKKAGALPSNADSIAASAKPGLSASATAASNTLTGWSVTLSEGDVLAFELESLSGSPKLLSLSLKVRLT